MYRAKSLEREKKPACAIYKLMKYYIAHTLS